MPFKDLIIFPYVHHHGIHIGEFYLLFISLLDHEHESFSTYKNINEIVIVKEINFFFLHLAEFVFASF
jgi:hypothetical protein